MPGEYTNYDFGFDLAIVTGILSSYLQQEVPRNSGFYGEVDLMGAVRSASGEDEAQILKDVQEDVSQTPEGPLGTNGELMEDIAGEVRRKEKSFMERMKRLSYVYVPKEIQEELQDAVERCGLELECIGVSFISELIGRLWPEVA